MKTRISIAFWLIQHWMRLVFRRNNWPRTHNKYNEKRFLFLFFSCLNCHVTISPHVVRIAILKTIRVGNFSFVAFRFHVDMADPFDLACFFFCSTASERRFQRANIQRNSASALYLPYKCTDLISLWKIWGRKKNQFPFLILFTYLTDERALLWKICGGRSERKLNYYALRSNSGKSFSCKVAEMKVC